ncbi:MAG: restriction endonuclease subunit S [Caldisericia bacterium]|nr:restriction endonuclease subunit S [Caldisericia bacterium]
MKTNLLQKNIPKGWQIKKIKDLLDFEQPTKYIVESSSYTPDGKTPVLTANKSFVLGYTNETDGIYTDTPAIIFDDFTTDSKYVDFSFKVKSSAIKILKNRDEDTDLKFVYEIMKSFNFPIANHKRHYISQYQELEIVIPSKKEQKKIADILSSIDSEINKIENLINTDEKLKIGLMQDFFNRKNWDFKKIDDVATVLTGGTPRTSTKEFWDGDINWMSSGEVNLRRVKNTEKKITQKGLDGSNATLLPTGTVMVALAGQGKTRGKVAILEIETTCNQSLAGIIANKESIHNEFLFYNLEYRYQELRNVSGGEGRAGLNLKLIKNFKVPVPPIETQKKISNTLASIDNRMNKNNLLKDKLVKLKKGLTSDLLSGKVRTINN